MGPLEAAATTRDSVTLEWKPPQDDGGSAITGYIIEKREALRLTWTRAEKTTDDTTTRTLKGLMKGDEFYFRVAAFNSQGSSEFLEMPRPVVIKSPFGECRALGHMLVLQNLECRTYPMLDTWVRLPGSWLLAKVKQHELLMVKSIHFGGLEKGHADISEIFKVFCVVAETFPICLTISNAVRNWR